MRPPDLRHRSGQALALLGLLIILPAWVVFSFADRLRQRLAHLHLRHHRMPLPRHLRDVLVVGLGVFLVAVCCMSVAVMGIGPTILAFLLVFAPPALLAFTWRRRDPVPGYLADLIQDCLSRDGWKCQVLKIGPPFLNEVNPFGFLAEGVRVYRVFLEDEWGQARFGWLRLGNGRIDFDLDEEASGEPLMPRSEPSRQPAMTLGPSYPAALAGRDPLWDRWLDG
jgi:hypothetical protein